MDELTCVACDRFDSILQEHSLTKWAIVSLAAASPESLAALVRVNSGMRKSQEVTTTTAEQWIEKAQNIAGSEKFNQLRSNLLIALCSSLEYAVKAFFVDSVNNRPGGQIDWCGIAEMLNQRPDDYADLDWKFAVADRLFDSRSKKQLLMADRFLDFVTSKCAVAQNKIFDQTKIHKHMLNQAYSTRNSVIHCGGYLNRGRQKSEHLVVTQVVSLDAQLLHGYVVALDEFMKALRNVSEQISLQRL